MSPLAGLGRTPIWDTSNPAATMPAVEPSRNYRLSVNGSGLNLDVGTFRVDAISFQVTPAYDRSSALDVQAAIDTEHHEHFLAELRRGGARVLVGVTVLRVEVSGDLRSATVYVSIMGNEAERKRAFRGDIIYSRYRCCRQRCCCRCHCWHCRCR